MEPYQLSTDELIKKYTTDVHTGLSMSQVAERRAQYGPNALPQAPTRSWLAIFLSQFLNPMIYLLLVAAVLISFVGPDWFDAFIITFILLFNAIIGTVQEGKAQNILESLQQFVKSQCIVIRDGKRLLIEDSELVVGDLIVIQEGEKVPADARIVDSNGVQVDEAALTGESGSVYKHADIIEDEVPLADRINMLFCGTYIVSGFGKAIVVATGIDSQIGKIQQSIAHVNVEMPLKKEVDRLAYWISVGVFIVCIFLFVVGFAAGLPITELLALLTALFICVVPEGLPVVLTSILAAGAYTMARHYVLVKKMQAIVTLGYTNVIMVDKTGTLTRNELMVTKVFTQGNYWTVSGNGYHTQGTISSDTSALDPSESEHLGLMAIGASLLNSTDINYDTDKDLFTVVGDPTQAALYIFSQKMEYSKAELHQEYKKIYELPFDYQLKYHAGFYQKDNQVIAFIVGSPESIMKRSSPGAQLDEVLQTLLEQGLRMIAMGIKKIPLDSIPSDASAYESFFRNNIEKDIEFVGFWGIQDAIRPEVPPMVNQARSIGIKVIMATGDHAITARYVAQKVGIMIEGDQLLDGSAFEDMSDQELNRLLNITTVYSRVTPVHKLRIITLFQKQGNIVAMTGDGVNDVPSLVAADLGIAMGNIGTKLAQEAADLILLDDSFVNIMYAVEQGRYIFGTLQRVVLYFLTTNMAEVFIVILALLLYLPLPLTAPQILWLNLITDGFFTMALAMEPKQEGLLAQSWLQKKMRLIDRGLVLNLICISLPMALGTLWLFSQFYTQNLAIARTMMLVSMTMYQWFNAWNCGSEQFSLCRRGLFTNRWLIIASIGFFILQAFLVYHPLMNRIFKTVPLSWSDWLLITVVTAPILIIEELRKFVVSRKS